jgi:hypothetical protein
MSDGSEPSRLKSLMTYSCGGATRDIMKYGNRQIARQNQIKKT